MLLAAGEATGDGSVEARAGGVGWDALDEFARLVGTDVGVEVRLRDWY